jgi:hypothetical protein
MTGSPDPARWTPVQLSRAGALRWCATEGFDFSQPFFTQTISTAMRTPFNQVFARVTAAGDLDPGLPSLPLTGMVFHASRCGSTLVSQAVAESDTSLSLSEPGVFEQVVRREDPGLIRALYAALAQPRRGTESGAVIKTDARAARHSQLLRTVFPAAPWLVMIRDPVEILVSQVAVPGSVMLATVDTEAMSIEERCGRMLGQILADLAAAAADPLAMVIDYRDLDQAGLARALDHLGVELTTERLSTVRARDAKNPLAGFDGDSEAKQLAATPEIRAAALRFTSAPYRALLDLAAKA